MESAFYVDSNPSGDFMTAPSKGQPPKSQKLLEQMRSVLRVQRSALRTEETLLAVDRAVFEVSSREARGDRDIQR